MDVINEDDEAMMAVMGLTGFGSSKGKKVEGNQEGGANVKKMRTWRQYMNRRGGSTDRSTRSSEARNVNTSHNVLRIEDELLIRESHWPHAVLLGFSKSL